MDTNIPTTPVEVIESLSTIAYLFGHTLTHYKLIADERGGKFVFVKSNGVIRLAESTDDGYRYDLGELDLPGFEFEYALFDSEEDAHNAISRAMWAIDDAYSPLYPF